MSRTEHSGEPGTLPAPELNPLLNPLLADNMGRWAQVYFTSPPEKREHAVYELLQELESEKAKREEAVASAPTSLRTPSFGRAPLREAAPVRPLVPVQLESQPTTIRCNQCGRSNPSSQKFCGMCGTRLGEQIVSSAGNEIATEDQSIADRHISDLHIEDQQIVNENETGTFRAYSEPQPIAEEREVYTTRSNANDLSLFQSIGLSDQGDNYGYGDEAQDGVANRSYRVYVGIALALIIGVLAYMAWRGVQATSRYTPATPIAYPEIPKESPPPAPATPDPAKTDAHDGTQSAAKEAASTTHESAAPIREHANSRAGKAVPVTRPKTVKPTSVPPSVETTAGTGNEELALAQRYLSGANGQARNSTEAARWLWKAMAKHNADAPLLLSDLYLRGDGVSKNCDQARILLDAAALRGVKDAGQRLRHLQAFGCQ